MSDFPKIRLPERIKEPRFHNFQKREGTVHIENTTVIFNDQVGENTKNEVFDEIKQILERNRWVRSDEVIKDERYLSATFGAFYTKNFIYALITQHGNKTCVSFEKFPCPSKTAMAAADGDIEASLYIIASMLMKMRGYICPPDLNRPREKTPA